MLKVGLDLRATEQSFKAHAGRGTGRYVTEVVNAMNLCCEQHGVVLNPIYSKDLEKNALDTNFIKCLPLGKRTAQSQWAFPRSISRLDHDLVHFFSHGDASAWGGLRQVITVLDLIPLKFPELYKAKKSNLRFKFARYLEYEAVRKASGILAISEATKRDVVSLLGVSPDKIVVTPLAADKKFFDVADSDDDSLRERYQLPQGRPMLLYVGGIDPRKNVEFLCEVFSKVFSQSSSENKPFLVLAGRIENDDQYPSLLSKIEQLGIREHVFQLGFVPDEDLPHLYRSAQLSIFPSLYEGFGLPVLESMASGTPVIAGNNSSIPEVVGEAFELFDDSQVDDWVRGIISYLNDEDLLLELGRRSLERAKQFSWERTAKATLEAYSKFSSNERRDERSSTRARQATS